MQFSTNIKMPLPAAAAATWQAILWRLLAVLVIGALLAKWSWVMFAPNSASVLPALQAGTPGSAEHLFGIKASAGGAVQSLMPGVKLVGVFAPDFAILELEGKRQAGLAVGQDVIKGCKLVAVASDHVVIEQGGVRQQFLLEGNAQAIKSAQAVTVTPLPPVATSDQAPAAAQLILPGKIGL